MVSAAGDGDGARRHLRPTRPAVSPATASTRPGWCRTSRRCSTTTPSCCACYAHWARRTGNPLAARVTEETARFPARRSAARTGCSPRRWTPTPRASRGSTYVWTPGAAREVLGTTTGIGRQQIFAVTAAGRSSTARRCCSCTPMPRTPNGSQRVRAALRAARAQRPQPARDDKVVTAWNGLAITALAEAACRAGPA